MANRRFEQFQLGLEKAVVTLYAQVAVGASGAPTLQAAKSKGIKSVTRASAGNYVIVLQDRYQSLLFADFRVLIATGGVGLAGLVRADNSLGTTPSITVEFVDGTGTPTDIASGATLLAQIVLKNSGV